MKKLENLGVPKSANSHREQGHHFAHLEVRTPTNLTPEMEAIAAKLHAQTTHSFNYLDREARVYNPSNPSASKSQTSKFAQTKSVFDSFYKPNQAG